MDTSQEERSHFERVANSLGSSDVPQAGVLALETIEQVKYKLFTSFVLAVYDI